MRRFRIIEQHGAPHRLGSEPVVAINARAAVKKYAERWRIKGHLDCLVFSDEGVEVVTMHCSPQRRKR